MREGANFAQWQTGVQSPGGDEEEEEEKEERTSSDPGSVGGIQKIRE